MLSLLAQTFGLQPHSFSTNSDFVDLTVVASPATVWADPCQTQRSAYSGRSRPSFARYLSHSG